MINIRKDFLGLILLLILLACTSSHSQGDTNKIIDFSDTTFISIVNPFVLMKIDTTGINYYYNGNNCYLFKIPVSFNHSVFQNKVNFKFTEFMDYADFRRTVFKSDVSFSPSIFKSKVFFDMVIFENGVSFYLADFLDTVFFNCRINSYVDFSDVVFYEYTEFSNSTFGDTVKFIRSEFNNTVNFSKVIFQSYANFKGASFNSYAVFHKTILPNYLDLRNLTRIDKELNLLACRPPLDGGKCKIALAESDIDKISLRMELFELWFPHDSIYIPLDTFWIDENVSQLDTSYGLPYYKILSIRNDSTLVTKFDLSIDTITYDEKASIYERVLNKLKSDGFMNSYEILDIEYKKYIYKNNGCYGFIKNFIQNIWWNYGYTKELIFLWAFVFWIIFSLANLKLFKILQTEVYPIIFLGDFTKFYYKIYSIKHVIYVFVYTAIIFFGLKISVSKFHNNVIQKHTWLFVYFYFMYLLGIVCLGFMVNLIFK